MTIEDKIKQYLTSDSEVKEILNGIGSTLRKQRKEAKISTVQFEALSGVPRHRLKLIEEGNANPTLGTIIKCFKIVEK